MKRTLSILFAICLIFSFCVTSVAADSRYLAETMTFHDYFPDANMAAVVADHLDKSADDTVTLEELHSIKYLSAYTQNISDITGIGYLINLITIDLSENQITDLPPEIGDLADLEVLQIDRNPLTSLPDEIGNLSKMTRLHIRITNLESLPDTISGCESLVELLLWSNKLEKIPSALADLQNLDVIHLDGNRISEIPSTLLDVWSDDTWTGYVNLASNALIVSIPQNMLSDNNCYFSDQTATLSDQSVDKGGTLDYTLLIPPFVQDLQTYTGGELKGSWEIAKPNGQHESIVAENGDEMSTYIFDQEGDYQVQYRVQSEEGYIIPRANDPTKTGNLIGDLTYITNVNVSDLTHFDRATPFTGTATSNTDQYELAIAGFIDMELSSGDNVLTLDQIKSNTIAVVAHNNNNGVKRTMNQTTIEEMTITVSGGQITQIYILGRVQTSPGTLDRYSTTITL